MARTALGWSVRDLAGKADVAAGTVTRFEGGQGAYMTTVDKLRAALEAGGVEFIPANGGGPGVRLKRIQG